MTTSNFNVQDFLFDNHIKIEETNQKTQEFDFINFWNTELMTANSSCDTQHELKSELTNLIGDITPAAAAVVSADNSSPLIETPLLDNSCMNTPFTPYLFTPQQLSNYNINHSIDGLTSTAMDSQLDDVNIANYLKNDSPWQDNITATTSTAIPDTPAITTDYLFGTLDSSVNVNPSELLLNNNTNSADDSLFPPITSNQQQDLSFALNTLNNSTADDLFLDNFDDLFPLTTEVIQNDKKRKHQQEDSNLKSTKRVKLSAQKSSDKDEKRFECDICHAKFSRRYNLGTHVKTHNKNRSKDFACSVCNKSFDRKHDLTRHVSTVHNGERAFGCSECSSFFSRKDALVRHRIQKHHYAS